MVKNYVKEIRQAAGLTLAQLADLSGIPVSTINDIEHGAEPRVVTAICLARALNTSVEKLWPA
jgi:transcriptional regulator with XRE-family HTH domain